MKTFGMVEHGTMVLVLQSAMVGMLTCQPTMAEINFTNFSNIDGLVLVGDAMQVGSLIRATSANPSQVGGFWHRDKQRIQSGFEAKFLFEINQDGADGVAFVIQNRALDALGTAGGSMGFGKGIGSGAVGIANCVAIEFDTHDNGGADWPDLPAPHISVQTRGSDTNHASHAFSLGATPIGNIEDGNTHRVRITYTPGQLAVYVDPTTTSLPTLTVAADLSSLLALDDGKAWVGFTAGTGGLYETHDILRWSFTEGVVPTPALILGCEYNPISSLASLRFTDDGGTYHLNLGDDTAVADQTILIDPANGIVDTSVAGEMTFQFLDQSADPVRFMWITSE